MAEVSRVFRRELCNEMREVEGPVAISLSGGVDSNSLACAASVIGCEFTSMSYCFENHQSQDFETARHNATVLDVPFLGVRLPTDEVQIVRDVVWLIREIGARLKTEIECCWPFIYQMRAAAERGFRSLVSGWGADDYYGLEKSAVIHHAHPREKFFKYREHRWAKPLPAQLSLVHRMARMSGISFVVPYVTNEKLHEAMFSLDWDQLHTPRQKEVARRAFEKELAPLTVYRHLNLQMGDSEIAARVGSALLGSEYNVKGWKGVQGVYNHIART